MHEATGNQWAAWALVAHNLLAASRLLKSHRDRFDASRLKVGDDIPDEGVVLAPELMLRGMTVEALLKCVWAKRGKRLVDHGSYIGVPGTGSYNLVQLADALSLLLSDEERHLMSRLSRYVEYAGRYPIPKKAERLRPERVPSGGRASGPHWRIPTDDVLLEGILERIYSELP
jgi:hypothetical protein